jgi:hypothetical protein
VKSSVDVSRKHGPFDMRWPSDRMDTTDGVPLAPLLGAAGALDWAAFSARYRRGRGRHDIKGVSAYAACKEGSARPRAVLSLVPTETLLPEIETESDDAGTQRLLAAVAAVQPGGRRTASPGQTSQRRRHV